MHCQHCGAPLRSRARFCNHCGQFVVERFGSAVLPAQETAAETPTENLSPKTRTAKNPPASSTLEGPAQPSTDQLGLRGTDRHLHKSTSEEIMPPLDMRTTVVDARAWREVAPTMPEPVTAPVVAAPVPTPLPPLPARAEAAQPAQPPPAETVYVMPSTEQLQQDAANKPFFTRILKPGENRQHNYLTYAVPLVLLAAAIIFFIAFFVLR